MALIRLEKSLALLGVVGALVLSPRLATASSCYPSVSIAWPSSGGELPAGADILLESFCLFGDEVDYTAAIDGTPASVREGDVLGAVRVEPEPPVGSNVVLEACVQGYSEDPSTCSSASFTVVAPPSDLSFVEPSVDLRHDLRWSWIDMRWYWGLRVEVGGQAENGGRPVLYRVGLSGDDRMAELTVVDGASDTSTHFADSILPPPGEQVCVTVLASDVFAASAEPVVECATVRAEPEHTCFSESDDPDDCIESSSGCAVGSRSAGWGVLPLLCLFLRRRRRRGH